MKKALYVILCMTLAMTLLAGCGKKDDTDYFDEGYTAVENGKYKDALEDFKKAAAQGDEQAQKAADIVSGYLNAKEAADLGNTDSAKEFLSKIPSDYKFYPIAGDVNALRLKVYGSDTAAKDAADEAEANENSKAENTAESALNEVEKLIGNGHIDLADLLHLVVILRQIHSRPGCTVYHHVRLDLRQHLLHSLFVCDIQLHIRHFRHSTAVCSSTVLRSDIGTNTLVPSLCQFIHHIMAQLSADACYKNFHIN